MKNDIKNMSETMIEKLATKAIQSIGSVNSILIHTTLFILFLIFYFLNIFDKNTILLVLTTIVSLEAIYLSIFIQMSVNLHSKKLQSVASEVEVLQKGVEDIQENVEDIQENVEEIQENVEDIQEDVEDIQENVEDIQQEEEEEEDADIKEIKDTINKLMKEVMNLKNKK